MCSTNFRLGHPATRRTSTFGIGSYVRPAENECDGLRFASVQRRDRNSHTVTCTRVAFMDVVLSSWSKENSCITRFTTLRLWLLGYVETWIWPHRGRKRLTSTDLSSSRNYSLTALWWTVAWWYLRREFNDFYPHLTPMPRLHKRRRLESRRRCGGGRFRSPSWWRAKYRERDTEPMQ